MKYRIAHVGAFDFENFGDLLFTDVLKAQLEKRIDVEKIVYFAPKACTMPNKNERVHSITELEMFVKENKIDAIIVGGGDLVHLRKILTYMPHISEEGWVTYDVLYMWVIPSLIAIRYGVPLLWNAPGVPLHFGSIDKEIVSYLCNAVDYISVRDEEAQKELGMAFTDKEIYVVPDSVLSVRNIIDIQKTEEIFSSLAINIERQKYVFAQFNMATSEDDFKDYAASLKKIQKNMGWKILIQPIGYACGDQEIIEKFKAIYQEDFIYPTEHFTQYEILALIANAALYVGTSLHGAIVSNSYGVPNVVVNSSHFNKIEGFIKMLGREETRVFKPKDIYNAFRVALNMDSSIIVAEKIEEIEEHFDKLVEVLSLPTTKEEITVQGLADYIHDSSLEIENLDRKNKELSTEVEGLEKILNEKREIEQKAAYYEALYNAAINSTSWKCTKPLRALTSVIRNRK